MKNYGWYEGIADGDIPSIDNGLEGRNRTIKDNHTLRERLLVGQYFFNASFMLKDFSLDRFSRQRKKQRSLFSHNRI